MHIAIAVKFLGESDGGSQRSMHALAARLTEAGHRVSVFAHTVPANLGEPVGAVEDMTALLEQARPDAVLTQLQWSSAAVDTARDLGVPSIFFSRLGEWMPAADLTVFNSHYCAGHFPGLGDRAMVLAPGIDTQPAEAARRDGRDVVLMINPIRIKGGARLVEIAGAMPETRFLAVGGWWDPSLDGIDLGTVPNLEHAPPVADLTPIWQRAVALLVPSVWPEPAGRVVVEACAAGVPVVGSGAGGSREMLGDAGLLIDEPDDPTRWAQAIRALWDDAARWKERSTRGLHRARAYQAESVVGTEDFLERLRRLTCRSPTSTPVLSETAEPRVVIPPELLSHRDLSAPSGHLLDPRRWEEGIVGTTTGIGRGA